MFKPRKSLLVLSAILCISFFAQAQDFTGKVIGVTDGDTISVLHNGQAEKIRLNSIDCPEQSQAFGEKAKQFASSQCFGLIVTIKSSGPDKYGRTLGTVILPDGRNLNQEMVKAGFGWWYKQYAPTDTTLQGLENEARIAKRGLWTDAHPVAPWDFRHGTAQAEVPLPTATHTTTMVPAADSDTVYGTATGTKFHRGGCQYLSKSKIPMTLKDATARGLIPCSVCKPITAKGNEVYTGSGIAPRSADQAPNSAARVQSPPVYGYSSGQRSSVQSQTETDTGGGDSTVYVTNTGKKYHAAGCRYLKSSRPISRSQAQASGYTACSACGGG